MFETTVNLFNLGAAIVTIAAFIVGGIKFAGMVTSRTDNLSFRIQLMEEEMKKLSDVAVKLAENAGKLNLIEERIMAQGKRLDDVTSSLAKRIDSLTDVVEKLRN